jgi:putative oxidoreductase
MGQGRRASYRHGTGRLRRVNPMSTLRTLRHIVSHPVLTALLRVALGAVFIVASLDKIQNPEAFATNIANYRLLPYTVINAIAIVLPWLEVVTGTLLVLGVWIRASTMIVWGLLLVFSVAISQALARGLDISCGCFSTNPVSERMSWWTLIWDLIWLSWGILIWIFDHGHYSLLKFLNTRKDKIASP